MEITKMVMRMGRAKAAVFPELMTYHREYRERERGRERE